MRRPRLIIAVGVGFLALLHPAFGYWQSRLQVSVGSAPVSACATLIGQVSNIIGCWDADVGVAKTGSAVTTWTDQSSNAYVLGLNTVSGQSAPVSPIFSSSSFGGKAGITCTSSLGQYLATTTSAVAFNSSTASFFMAGTLTSSAGAFARGYSFVSTGSTDDSANPTSIAAMLRDSSNQSIEFFGNGSAGGGYVITYATPSRFGVVFDGSNGTTFLNNVLQTLSPQGFTTLGATGQISLCNAAGSGTPPWDGVIRRLVLVKGAVSSGDRTNIDTFLSN